MFEEIKLAFKIAKVFKETEWNVIHQDSIYAGNHQAYLLADKNGLGDIYIGSGYSHLRGYMQYKYLEDFCDFSKLIIWYFGGLDEIYNQYYVSKSEMKKRKIKQLHDTVCK